VANAGISQTVALGAFVTLNGSASTGGAPLSFVWTAPAGITLSSPTSAVTTFTAPFVGAATPLTFALTVTNSTGSSTASVTVTINPASAPTAFAWATQVVPSGATVTLHGSGTDPNGLPLTYHWVQGGPTAEAWPVSLFPSANVQSPIFSLTLPPAQPQVVLWFTLTVTNSLCVSSAPDVTTVTVQPIPDTITITLVEYRAGKQRLTVNATSSVVSPNLDLTLQPYTSTSGATVAGGAMTNLGAGNYQIVLVGVPQPNATGVTVTSNLGGNRTSPITRLRQQISPWRPMRAVPTLRPSNPST
jgi:hypothetical protein